MASTRESPARLGGDRIAGSRSNRARDYDQLLTVEQSINTQDDDGGVLKRWVEVKQVWGIIKPLAGKESTIAQGVNAQVQFSISFRSTDGIAPEARIVNGSRVFDITAVLDRGRAGEIELLCTQRM